MCKTVIDFNEDQPKFTIEGHNLNEDEICVWCGIEVPGYAEYVEKHTLLSVNLSSGQVIWKELEK